MVVRIRKSGWGRGREEHAWKRGRTKEGKEVEREGGRAGGEDECFIHMLWNLVDM